VKAVNVKIRRLRKKMRTKTVENNYYFTGVLILLLTLLAFCGGPAHAGSTQTNTSGSNTAIEGGYTSTATTTYQSGSSSNSTTTNTTNSNIRSAPPSASAPSYNSMTQDVCAVGVSAGVQTFGVGLSGGKHTIDKNCERLKLARILNDFGMKVAAVAILCQDERVFESMIQAGTPCPIDGKIGKEAQALWSKYDHERPDYKTYVKRMDDRKAKEKKIAEAIAKEEARLKEEELKNLKKVR
jgi:hypothetical protein|tara:strand:- start:116 stop:835 length:720 start_codon:yes stop_codon:yes gene_type:complete